MAFKKLVKKEKFSLTFAAITFLLLFSLGIWQVIRLYEKNHQIASVFENVKHPPMEITKDSNLPTYSKVKLEGKIISDKAFWLYRRHGQAKNIDGAYLAVPVETNNSGNYLCLVGWFISKDHAKIMEELASQQQTESFVGLLLNSEKFSSILPANDYKNKIIFTLDLKDISEKLDIKLHNRFIAILTSSLNLEHNMYKISEDMMINVKNDHFGYAATWFFLASAFFWLYFLYVSKKLKEYDSN